MYDGRVFDLRVCKELYDASRAAEDAAWEALSAHERYAIERGFKPGRILYLTTAQRSELDRLRAAAEVATRGWIDALERWIRRCGGLGGPITSGILTDEAPAAPPEAGASAAP